MIVMELKGGLGNQMFQYALGRHLSIKNNCPLLLDPSFLLDRRFKNPSYTYRNFDLDIFQIAPSFVSEDISKQYGLLRPKSIRLLEKFYNLGSLQRIEERQFAFDERVLEVVGGSYLAGYWQSEKYFEAIASEIKKDFSLAIPLNKEIDRIRKLILSENAVCLHVRRTDFLGNPIHELADRQYYERAEKIMQNEIGRFIVYIFSDDISWCKRNLQLSSKSFFVNSGKNKEALRNDIFLMSQFKHFIIPNSTFSWWAAWLSDHEGKKIICPKKWINSNEPFYSNESIIPPNWISI